MIVALAVAVLAANTPAPPPAAEQDAAVRVFRAAQAAEAGGFRGEVLVGFRTWNSDTNHPASGGERRWRWASVTKQVVATLVMQQVASGKIALDAPLTRYLPGFRSANAGAITVRYLLRHQTGLPDPDDTAAVGDVPGYYTAGWRGSRDPLTGYCAGPVKGPAGGRWAYNNCDYIVAGALLHAVTGRAWQDLFAERIAKPFGLTDAGAFPARTATVPGTIDGKPEPAIAIHAFGAAGALYGTAADLWRFDRALMSGALLPQAARDEMWDGQPALGSIALGQWSFTAPLKGCAAPVRIVERRGEIGGVGVRNFILPAQDRVLIVFTDKGGHDFGEVWQGKGFSYDLLSAAACA